MPSRGFPLLARPVRALFAATAMLGMLGGLAAGAGSGPVRAATTVATTVRAGLATPDLIELNAVACAREGYCLAVGQDVTTGHSFAKSWNGAAWRVLPAVAAPSSPAALWDVACPPSGGCIAVGSYSDVSGFGFTLAAAWDGTRWRLLRPVSPGLFDGLSGVACPAPRRCVAVGATLGASFKTLAEVWDGTRWRLLATPTPGGWGALNAVACPRPAWCVAVGSTGYGGIRRPLALAWNGTRWLALARPLTPDGFGNLMSISCDGPRMCVVDGYSGVTGGAGPPLVELWNGTAWQLVPLPLQ
jgi:hypothetical protein